MPSSNIKIGKRGTYSFVYDDNKGTVAVSYSDKFESGYTAGTRNHRLELVRAPVPTACDYLEHIAFGKVERNGILAHRRRR